MNGKEMPKPANGSENRLDRLLAMLPQPAPMDAAFEARLLAIPEELAELRRKRASWRPHGVFAMRIPFGEAALLAASLIAGLYWGAIGMSSERAPDLSSLVLGQDSGFPEEGGQ
ncbi:MAG: hypothetical protein Tsb008_05830 [Rhodothalassiaceae bacterium]